MKPTPFVQWENNRPAVGESEQIEVRECFLSLGAESVVFQVVIQILKDQDIQNYNFARGFVWV